ncbi:NAD(P)H-binding protein [Streptomyces goshikiensis]|uniref:NAD(P)H-binding protein n=1 Tax=Streptomyces goshikiensis TaxID=1942 RepID=UPI003721BBC2
MIVITTPTGDIGRQVLDRVLDSGEPVRVIVRDPSRLPEHVRTQVEVVEGSHADADTIAKALDGADRLFWLVPPAGFRDAGPARRYYLDFARAVAQEATSRGVRMVHVTSLGHGYQD